MKAPENFRGFLFQQIQGSKYQSGYLESTVNNKNSPLKETGPGVKLRCKNSIRFLSILQKIMENQGGTR